MKVQFFISVAPLLLSASSMAGTKLAPTQQVPQHLETIESLAEDSYDQALAANYREVAKDAKKIEQEWQSFRTQALADGVSPADVKLLDQSIVSLQSNTSQVKSAVELARTANSVSEPMDRLFAVYAPTVPPTLNRLDYLGRELLLDGMLADFTAAADHFKTTQTVWMTVHPDILQAGGTSQALEFEKSLSLIKAAIDAHDGPAVSKAAKQTLDQVDEMENIFHPGFEQ